VKFHEKSVQWEPSYSMRTERQTDITKLTVAFRNFAKAPKTRRLGYIHIYVYIYITHTHKHNTYLHTYTHTYIYTYIHTYKGIRTEYRKPNSPFHRYLVGQNYYYYYYYYYYISVILFNYCKEIIT